MKQEGIDWAILKKGIEDNWFETDPPITDAEIDDMAIDLSRVVDDFINKAIETRKRLIAIVISDNDESEKPNKLMNDVSQARLHELDLFKQELKEIR